VGGWLAHSRHPAAPRALRRDICIRNGSLAPELPRTQGQGEIRRSQQRWSWDPGTGHSPELGLVPAAHVQWLPPPHGDREPSLASQFCAATSFLPLLKLIIPEYKGLHSLQHPGSLRNAAPHTSANPDTLLSPSPAGAPGLLSCWDHHSHVRSSVGHATAEPSAPTHPSPTSTRSTDPGPILYQLPRSRACQTSSLLPWPSTSPGDGSPRCTRRALGSGCPEGAASSKGANVSSKRKLLPPAPSHLLDEVEAPMQRGVHLPASGQPWKDRAEAAVTLPRPAQPLPSRAGVLHRSRALAWASGQGAAGRL